MNLRLSPLLLLLLVLGACTQAPDAGTAADPAADADAVDPAALDVDVTPEAPLPEAAPVWEPKIEPAPKDQFRARLRAAAEALELGRIESNADGEGALEAYLGVLATEATHAEATAGVDRCVPVLLERGAAAAREGQLAEAARLELIVRTLRPSLPELATLQSRLQAARKAADAVRLGDARAKAGRELAPAGRSALEAYREALAQEPLFVPALDGLARLEASRLRAALAAAQQADYAGSDRLLMQAGQIRPGSPAVQDLAARIVELRSQRASELLQQGRAALAALDIETAAKRLAAARVVSVQATGLDDLRDAIELARLYGRHRPGQVFRDAMQSGLQAPEMVVIPHGSFRMGSEPGEIGHQPNEAPAHELRFARGFAIARNEVTVAEFRQFVVATNYRSVAQQRGRSTVYDERGGSLSDHERVDWRRDHSGAPATPTLPVVHVAFADAEAYAAWLSAQTGQTYRLPSEAEFEYVLRGGGSTPYPWGKTPPMRLVGNLTGAGDRSRTNRRWSNAIANYDDGHWGPAPVRSYPVEPFATYDLIGNVSEWVLDCWHDSYRRAPADGSAWVNPGCEERVLRGASWASSLDRARSAWRQPAPADTTHARIGFRLVREI